MPVRFANDIWLPAGTRDPALGGRTKRTRDKRGFGIIIGSAFVHGNQELPPMIKQMDGVDKTEKIERDEVAERPESWIPKWGRGRKPPALLGFDIQSSDTAPRH